jgi:hypothetical protein
MIDPFRLCIALLPLAAYYLALGVVNFSKRPLVLNGARDAAGLAAALAGLIAVGPLELFMPAAAATRFGGFAWLLLVAFYALICSLAILLARPRLVIYNILPDQLRPILAELVPSLDPQARWAGDSLAMPTLGVQLHLDALPTMRNVALVASGEKQNLDGWRKLEKTLAAALRKKTASSRPRGRTFLVVALLLIALCLAASARDPQALAQGMRDMLRL